MSTKSSRHTEKLAQNALRASRLSETLHTNGWVIIQEIIQEQYNSLMNDLLKEENPEARGGINAIIEIMNTIDQDMKFGEVAQKKYKEAVNAGL